MAGSGRVTALSKAMLLASKNCTWPRSSRRMAIWFCSSTAISKGLPASANQAGCTGSRVSSSAPWNIGKTM
ncbi:hypothetical protein D9M68_980920 [compost metagenome]